MNIKINDMENKSVSLMKQIKVGVVQCVGRIRFVSKIKDFA